MFYELFKSIAFQIDPEVIHNFSIATCSRFSSLSRLWNMSPLNSAFDFSDGHMQWSSPIGLAAGLDKNAQAVDFFSGLGFGAIEIGTITPIAQKGNPLPRIWRDKENLSLRNAMGFPNQGMEAIYQNLLKIKSQTVIGSNIGKNKDTSPDDAALDYAKLYEKFAPVSQYIVINVSSPNTPGLRSFQKPKALENIFSQMRTLREQHPRPLYLKISPDIHPQDISDIVAIVNQFELNGIIATNTTSSHSEGVGGVSGDRLYNRSKEVRELFLNHMRNSSLSLIGVGGFSNYEQLKDFWKKGGSFVQIYTALIYQGPSLISKIHQQILSDMQKNGYSDFQRFYNSLQQ